MRFGARWAGLWVLVVAGILPCVAAAARGPTTRECLECHGVAGEKPAGKAADPTSIFLGDWEKSVHGGFECTDCHAGIKSLPHDTPLERPTCAACHSDESANYARGTHAARAVGDSLAPRCASCHDPHTVRSSSDSTSVLYRSHVAQVCARCHADANGVGERQLAVPHPAQSYARGAHEHAMQAGNLRAATCGDCHDSHLVLRAQDPASPVFRQNIPQTCGRCHKEEYALYRTSVHGLALARGGTDAPVCNTCHGEHAVAARGERGRTTFVASHTCESCHSNPALNRRYDLPVGAVSSYEDSYHGRAARGGLAQAAGCTSCHGAHSILPKSDPQSSINPANLVQTCGQCHTKATPEFAASYAHTPDSEARTQGPAAIVRSIYLWLIVAVIGGMLAHNAILYRHQLRREFAVHKQKAVHTRLTRVELRQHAVLLTTFFILVITGFALRYPDDQWVRALAAMGFTEGVRRVVHRVAAVGMIAASFFHLYYMFTRRGREQMRHMAPVMRDVHEAIQNVRFYLGQAAAPPRFTRFRYIEKAEYWALIWGTAVMAITGLILWFPSQLQGPNWLVRVAEAIHLYEAWLAFLAIVVWHLFFVVVRPGIPGAFTAITGKMDPEELAHEHPEDYAHSYESPPPPHP